MAETQWLTVWDAVVARLEEDLVVVAALTPPGASEPAIYLDGARAFEVPSMTGVLVSDFEEERFNRIDLQLNVFVRSLAALARVENRVRWMFTKDVRASIAGVRMWSEFLESRAIPPYLGPDDKMVFGKQMDFAFRPIRKRYVRVEAS